ncbi:MAG: hypothetical protein E7219_05525 [Clostridiales bacterium]|jgi:hypothetical protein|nr:hypothetical protein [Clostridiales bacterium]
MDYNNVIEHFAQKVDEPRREEFKAKASKIEDVSAADALAREFGIEPSEEDRKEVIKMLGVMELSPEMLRDIAAGCNSPVCGEWGYCEDK